MWFFSRFVDSVSETIYFLRVANSEKLIGLRRKNDSTFVPIRATKYNELCGFQAVILQTIFDRAQISQSRVHTFSVV